MNVKTNKNSDIKNWTLTATLKFNIGVLSSGCVKEPGILELHVTNKTRISTCRARKLAYLVTLRPNNLSLACHNLDIYLYVVLIFTLQHYSQNWDK